MRQQIRYQTILSQITAKYGSQVVDSTATRVNMFTAALMDCRLALGQAFVPIVNIALPYLTALMNYLAKALRWISGFVAALFGKKAQIKAGYEGYKSTGVAVGNIGKAAGKSAKAVDKIGKAQKKANKEAKAGLQSFDEVHTLAEKTADATKGAGAGGGGGAAGGGGGGQLPSPPTPSTPPIQFPAIVKITEKMKELAEKVKKFFKPVIEIFKEIWTAIKTYLMDKVAGISEWWKKNAKGFSAAWSKMMDILMPILKFIVKMIWEDIKGAIDGLIQFVEGLVEVFIGIFTGDWGKIWQGMKDILVGGLKAIWHIVSLFFGTEIIKPFKIFFKFGDGIFGSLTKLLIEKWGTFMKWIKGITKDIFMIIWTDIRGVLTGKLVPYLKNLWLGVKMIFAPIVKWVKGYFQDAWTGVKLIWNAVTGWFKKWIIDPVVTKFGSLKTKIGDAFSGAWDLAKKGWNKAVTWFEDLAGKIKKKFTDIKEGVVEGIKSAFKDALNFILRGINADIKMINKVKNNVPFLKGLGDIPEIKYLAAGGIVSSPIHAVIGEGSEPEAVAPLSELMGMISSAVAGATAFNNTGKSQDVKLVLDGRTIGRLILPHIQKEQQRIGNNIRLGGI